MNTAEELLVLEGKAVRSSPPWVGLLYNRMWWDHDENAQTVGGGMMNINGRYLTLLPLINGADAISGSPDFTANPGDKAHQWDSAITFHWMPRQYITWWLEGGYRHSMFRIGRDAAELLLLAETMGPPPSLSAATARRPAPTI